MCTGVSSYYICEIYEFFPALSTYYILEMYECVQLSLRIRSVKCTNICDYLFILRLWNVRICLTMSSYYVCKIFESVQLSLYITPAKCTTVELHVVSHFILRKLLISLLMCPVPAIRVMNFRVEWGSNMAKDSRRGLDFINVKWLNGHQSWIWSDLWPVLFWDTPQHTLIIFFSSWIFWPLKMGPIDCPETSVTNYHDMVHSISEERKTHLLRGGSLNSNIE